MKALGKRTLQRLSKTSTELRMPPKRFPPLVLLLTASLIALRAHAEIGVVQVVAPNVYFHEGDVSKKGHCNNGWIVLEDYALVVDANFPSGARDVLPKIKATTSKPIRFTFDTHHHGDHAYGNQIWHEAGATLVANAGVITEMKKYEGRFYGGAGANRWDDAAKARKDVAETSLKPPTVLFNKDLIFDDGTTRVELLHFGTAHTHGDGFAWLPKEKILFTGDACVNGAYNYTADGNIGDWIKTLRKVQGLGALVICPGHGPMGGPEVLEDQIQFFEGLQQEAKKLWEAKKSAAEAMDSIEGVIDRLKANARIHRFVGKGVSDQLEKAWKELGGAPFPR